jgi:hypothetical protein
VSCIRYDDVSMGCFFPQFGGIGNLERGMTIRFQEA